MKYQPLDRYISTGHRWMAGEKKQMSHPSVMSPGRYGMSWRAAKVKPRHEPPPPQDPGRRFRETDVRGREGGVPAPCTCLQHLGDSEVLLEQKRRSDTPGLPDS